VPQAVECLLLMWKLGVQIPIKKKYPKTESYQKKKKKKQDKNGILIKERKKFIFCWYWGLYLIHVW
jgi:hypothetical protein